MRDAVVQGLAEGADELLVVNFANADMVGHTGVIEAAVRGIETVDACMGAIRPAVAAAGGLLCVTADHGNSEVMLEPDGSPNTAHTTNPVPLWIDRPGLAAARGRGARRRRPHALRPDGLGPEPGDDRAPAGLSLARPRLRSLPPHRSIAANVDVVLVVQGLDRPLKLAGSTAPSPWPGTRAPRRRDLRWQALRAKGRRP